jgi:hypothetical protein
MSILESVKKVFYRLKDAISSKLISEYLDALGNTKTKRYIILYGVLAASLAGAITYFYIIRKRRQKTTFQAYLSSLSSRIHSKIYKNSNPYLSALFMSFSMDTEKELKEFKKLKSKKLRQAQLQSDPLLPPFEVGVFISDLSSTHCLLFDMEPKLRGQMLISTKDFEFQNLQITPKDIEACLVFIKATDGFVLYKSNDKVGAKLNHKHIHACLNEQFLPLMETYSQEIDNRRTNMNRYTEEIHAKVNELTKFEYFLVGFEKITLKRKDVTLNVLNMRERSKAICRFFA